MSENQTSCSAQELFDPISQIALVRWTFLSLYRVSSSHIQAILVTLLARVAVTSETKTLLYRIWATADHKIKLQTFGSQIIAPVHATAKKHDCPCCPETQLHPPDCLESEELTRYGLGYIGLVPF